MVSRSASTGVTSVLDLPILPASLHHVAPARRVAGDAGSYPGEVVRSYSATIRLIGVPKGTALLASGIVRAIVPAVGPSPVR